MSTSIHNDLEGQGTIKEEILSDNVSIELRHGFIRKVYSIVSVQMLLTLIISSVCVLVEPAREWLQINWWMYIVGISVAMVSMIAISCKPQIAYIVPYNYMVLLAVTLGMSMAVSAAAVYISIKGFMLSIGILLAVVGAITLFAIQTKIDFTGAHIYVFVAMLILMFFGIFVFIWPNDVMVLLYASLGVLIVSFALILDTQRLVGGKNKKYQLTIDDYVIGALCIYMDIINLWILIMEIIGRAER